MQMNKNMNTSDLETLKREHKEIIKKACVYTNIAYALVEVADTIMNDVNSTLNEVGAGINKDEMRKLKNIKIEGKRFKFWLADFARLIYKIDVADDALDDADNLYDIILLIMDRCGGRMDILSHIRAMIFNSFKSKYGYYR